MLYTPYLIQNYSKYTFVPQLTAAVGKVRVHKTQFDFYDFQPKKLDMLDESEFTLVHTSRIT